MPPKQKGGRAEVAKAASPCAAAAAASGPSAAEAAALKEAAELYKKFRKKMWVLGALGGLPGTEGRAQGWLRAPSPPRGHPGLAAFRGLIRVCARDCCRSRPNPFLRP